MKYLLIFSLFLSNILTPLAQEKYSGDLVVYPTYSHFERDSGIVHEGNYLSTGSTHLFGGRRYLFKEATGPVSGKRKKMKLFVKDIWGFKWGEALYRISPSLDPMYVFYNGKIVYYEVCYFHISVSSFVNPTHQNPDRDVDVTEAVLSENLNSTLYAVKYTDNRRKADLEGVMSVLKKHPKGMDVFNCLIQRKTYKELRECIQLLDGK